MLHATSVNQFSAFNTVPPIQQKRERGVTNAFEIHPLGCLSGEDLWEEERVCRLNKFELIWIRSGEGEITIDLQKITLEPDCIYLLAPGQMRHLRRESELSGYYISMTEEFLLVCLQNTEVSLMPRRYTGEGIQRVRATDAALKKEMEIVVDNMLREYTNFFQLRFELLKGWVNIFLIYLARQMEGAEEAISTDAPQILKKFMALVRTNFTTKKRVVDYAKELFVTPNYLNKIVKFKTGHSASFHIQQSIILEAKRHALHSDMTMKEVSYLLGFDNIAHFSKFFKNAAGVNFSCFKKNSREGAF
jgi:AraC family transcriptional regulator, transcriptional activator of pobA